MIARTAIAAIALLFMCPFIFAQDSAYGPEGKKPLDKLGFMLGNWEGAGAVRMVPGAPKMKWTCTNTFELILGGHFIQEDVKIQFEGDMPDMFFRTFYGWDAQREEYVSFSVGSTGELQVFDHSGFTKDGHFVMLKNAQSDSGPTSTRTTLELGDKDRMVFRVEIATGASPFTVAVSGVLERGGDGFTLTDESLEYSPMPAAEPMKKLSTICGDYTMKGEMSMSAGSPTMKIGAKERVESIFGGTIIRMIVDGEAAETGFAYRGLAFLRWDPASESYSEVWLNNMGQWGEHHMYWASDRELVIPMAKFEYGQAQASRTRVILDETGGFKQVIMDRMGGSNKPDRAFYGEYERVEKSGPEKSL